MTNFATPDDVAEVWRPLSAAEKANAEMLLSAAARWIRRRCGPGVDLDAAKLVSIDVVKAALIPGAHAGYESFSKGIGPWSKSGELINPSAALQFLDWHKEELGLPSALQPSWHFGDCP